MKAFLVSVLVRHARNSYFELLPHKHLIFSYPWAFAYAVFSILKNFLLSTPSSYLPEYLLFILRFCLRCYFFQEDFLITSDCRCLQSLSYTHPPFHISFSKHHYCPMFYTFWFISWLSPLTWILEMVDICLIL